MSNQSVNRWLEQAEATRGEVTSALELLDHPGASDQVPAHAPTDSMLLDAATDSLRATPPGASAASDEPPTHLGAPGDALPFAAPAQPQLPPLFAALLGAGDVRQACAAVATRLCQDLACERVFVGAAVGRFVQVVGIAHGGVADPNTPWLAALGAAMDEAADQGATICHPADPAERPRITQAHAEFARLAPGRVVLTVPMFTAGDCAGALCFTRPVEQGFAAADVACAERIGAALAPLLRLRWAHEGTLSHRLHGAWQRHVGAHGRRHQQLMSAAAMAMLLGSAALLATPWSYEVVAGTRLEGRIQRAVVAPVDGYLKSARVRAGDVVKADDLLAELNDDDLRLEHQRLESELARNESTFAEAQARADRAQLVVASSRVAESRAQLSLIAQQIQRTQLRAPFDAHVIAGDLAPQLGAPVKRGDVMLTLAPSRDFRVLLEIDERDIASVHPGTRGWLALSAMPERRFALSVEHVLPVARAADGRNVFEAEARLDAAGAADLRPGLQGLARLNAGERRLAWIIGHRFVDWLRMQWWAWLG